jgi:hypothetical protein
MEYVKNVELLFYETAVNSKDPSPEARYSDYKNACSNELCKENIWHYVGDQEFLDYYDHV